MKILIDVDALERTQVLTPELATQLKAHALRDTGSTAINILLAFGALAIAVGILALKPTPLNGSGIGLMFVLAGAYISYGQLRQWSKLGAIWMIVGALILAGGVGALINEPLAACLAGAAILAAVGVIAGSRLLIGLVPLALLAAVGGSAGYWDASYAISVREPTLTILMFSALAFGTWHVMKKLTGLRHSLALVFARVCVVLANLGFWVGSLFGDTPGGIWRHPDALWISENPQIPDLTFVVIWFLSLLAVGYWGAKQGRRFVVNTVTTFGAIHLYTQWFERFDISPISLIVAGVITIAIGLGLWTYNKSAITQE